MVKLIEKGPIHNIVFKDRKERIAFQQKRRHCWNDLSQGNTKYKLAKMNDSMDVRCSNCMFENNMVCVIKASKIPNDDNPCKEWDLKVLGTK